MGLGLGICVLGLVLGQPGLLPPAPEPGSPPLVPAPSSWLLGEDGALSALACVALGLAGPGLLGFLWLWRRGLRQDDSPPTVLRAGDLLTVALAWFLLALLAAVLSRLLPATVPEAGRVLGPALVTHLALLGFILAVVRVRHGVSLWSLVERTGPVARNLLCGLLAYVALLPLQVGLLAWLQGLVVARGGVSPPQHVAEIVFQALNRGPGYATLAVGFVLVVAPLYEEVLYRGVLQRVLVRRLGRGGGVILAALLFTIVHLPGPELAPYVVIVFTLGLLLGVVYEACGQLRVTVAMHALHNGLTLVLLVVTGG
jgi:membrane protease YdiL (CAAX protease family)